MSLRLRQEIQAVLRQGDGELIFNKLAIYSTAKSEYSAGTDLD